MLFCPPPFPLLEIGEAGGVKRGGAGGCRTCRDIESLWGQMGESERQVEGLFESLLAEVFAQ